MKNDLGTADMKTWCNNRWMMRRLGLLIQYRIWRHGDGLAVTGNGGLLELRARVHCTTDICFTPHFLAITNSPPQWLPRGARLPTQNLTVSWELGEGEETSTGFRGLGTPGRGGQGGPAARDNMASGQGRGGHTSVLGLCTGDKISQQYWVNTLSSDFPQILHLLSTIRVLNCNNSNQMTIWAPLWAGLCYVSCPLIGLVWECLVFTAREWGVTGDPAQNMFTTSCRESLAGNISYLLWVILTPV